MSVNSEQHYLPLSDCGNLHLAHPTGDECVKISTNTFALWGDSLELSEYLEESLVLAAVPLAKDGGMTRWVLVDKRLAPNERPLLCSCETFYKRSLASDSQGKVKEAIIHGIASVFCPEEYRQRGYAARLMKELAGVLCTWQSGDSQAKVVGSVLYSDIGKVYYTKLGWPPNATNMHIEFPPISTPKPSSVRDIGEADLPELCKRDEAIIRSAMATPTLDMQQRVVVVPDLDHMLWHIGKEDFATHHLFKKRARAKGAIAGPPGNQVWAIWTHRYYGRHDAESSNNVLYILRLVVEGDPSANQATSVDTKELVSLSDDQVTYLEAVLQAAQAEAAEWHLDRVKLWDPSSCVEKAIRNSNMSHAVVEREDDSIASVMWYNEDDSVDTPPAWINNEHYAWC
ncbi:putative lysine acetyltransferase protein [Rosellinia necatrix]|uniref:Putative lysine acetyltransferase protein n=1 Tax=Rosellinia necatrix TaxID=77044 RepID=A0A1W2TJ25_ROSNE|nr:putative lysine acetyltransferase protein [Rosellinia necatrix]